MNIIKIATPVVQKITTAVSCGTEKLQQAFPKAPKCSLNGLDALAGYNKPIVTQKNTVTMKLAKDGIFKGFVFFDGDKRIGQAVLQKIDDMSPDFIPKNWLADGIQKTGSTAKRLPVCFVNEFVIDDMCKTEGFEYLKRAGGKKYGTMCMQKILEWTEQNGFGSRIALEPSLYGSNVHPGKFYAKIGFDIYPKAKEIVQSGDAKRIAKGFAPMTNYDGRYVSTGQMVVLTNPEVLKNYPL